MRIVLLRISFDAAMKKGAPAPFLFSGAVNRAESAWTACPGDGGQIAGSCSERLLSQPCKGERFYMLGVSAEFVACSNLT
jgi:hypothetical protein